MSKSITCKFKPPLSWADLLKLDLGSVIYQTAGGSQHIEAIRVSEKDFHKVSSILKNEKIAFKSNP